MIYSRKGQGISINVIIIAAIALLVLIILAVLIARSGGEVSKGTDCISKGGVCKTSNCDYPIGGSELCGGKTREACCSPVPRV